MGSVIFLESDTKYREIDYGRISKERRSEIKLRAEEITEVQQQMTSHVPLDSVLAYKHPNPLSSLKLFLPRASLFFKQLTIQRPASLRLMHTFGRYFPISLPLAGFRFEETHFLWTTN
jgi:hypothetical protein